MKIRIHVPSHLGAYKLNKQARRTSAKRLIDRHVKLFARMRQKITSIILIVDDKEYFVKPKSEQKVLIEHAEGLLNEQS